MLTRFHHSQMLTLVPTQGSVLYGIPSTLESSFALVAHLRKSGRPTDEGFFLRRDQDIAGVEERGRRRLMDVYR